MNLFGADVRGQDVVSFLAAACAAGEVARYGVSHYVVTSRDLDASGLTRDDLGRRPYLEPLAVGRDDDGSFSALFEVRS